MALYHKLRCYRLAVKFLLTVVVGVFTLLIATRFDTVFESFDLIMPLEADNETTEFVDSKCVLPKVDPFRVDVMKLIRKLPPIKCNGKKRYGTVVGQELRLNVNGLDNAKMMYIIRLEENDFNVGFSEAIAIDLTKTGMCKKLRWRFALILLVTLLTGSNQQLVRARNPFATATQCCDLKVAF